MKLSNILVYKDVKGSMLSHFILCGVVSLVSTIQAARPGALFEAKNNESYILQHYTDRVSSIQEEAYLAIAEMSATFIELINPIAKHREAYPHPPQLFVLMTYNLTTQDYSKYLFVSHSALMSSSAQQKAAQLNDQLIKSFAEPLLSQVGTFLAQRPQLEVKPCILPKVSFCRLPCRDMYIYRLRETLPTQKEGYQKALWPKLTPPAGVVSPFYRLCLGEERCQLPIAGYSKVYNLSHLTPHSLNLTVTHLNSTWVFEDQDSTPFELPLYDMYGCDGMAVTLNVTNITKFGASAAAVSTVTTQHVPPNPIWVPIMGYLLLVCGYFHFVLLILPPPLRYSLLRPPFMLITATLHMTMCVMS